MPALGILFVYFLKYDHSLYYNTFFWFYLLFLYKINPYEGLNPTPYSGYTFVRIKQPPEVKYLKVECAWHIDVIKTARLKIIPP